MSVSRTSSAGPIVARRSVSATSAAHTPSPQRVSMAGSFVKPTPRYNRGEMPIRIGVLVMLAALGTAACSASDTREWMKVNQRYTKEEFVRDHKECSRDSRPDEACMRQRGWVPVSPSKSEPPPNPDQTPRSRGRY